MIDWTEIADGESWEAFARDFVVSLGLVILHEPGRGPDGGKDFIAAERVAGRLSRSDFEWLVSCKHFAHSGRAVGVDDELNIVERVSQHQSDGFMGFYSTIASSALIERLRQIETGSGIGRYVWDGRSLESSLLNMSQSNLMMRYLPASFTNIRPIVPLTDETVTLNCEICDKDVLRLSLVNQFSANVIFAYDDNNIYQKVAVCCKGVCDKALEDRLFRRHQLTTAWDDITDRCNHSSF